MSTENETVADIVASLRDGSIYDENGCFDSKEIADRIEAAWKRERDELVYSFDPTKAWCSKAPDSSAYAIEGMKGFEEWKRNKEPSTSPIREEGDSGNPECLKKDNGDIVPQRKSFGNAAAMREALENIEKFADDGWYDSYTKAGALDRIVDLARSAISAPPRNCDRFVDELDAQLAFLNEVWLISVDRETMLDRDKYENWSDEMRTAYGRWLFANAKEVGSDGSK